MQKHMEQKFLEEKKKRLEVATAAKRAHDDNDDDGGGRVDGEDNDSDLTDSDDEMDMETLIFNKEFDCYVLQQNEEESDEDIETIHTNDDQITDLNSLQDLSTSLCKKNSNQQQQILNKSSDQLTMYPVREIRLKMDDYGEFIKHKDFETAEMKQMQVLDAEQRRIGVKF